MGLVAAASRWGRTPRESIEAECARRGHRAVVAGCIDLLRGGDADPALILALGGPPAQWAVTSEVGGPGYWLRVWAARGLLWVWDDTAQSAVLDALNDDAWRVREMSAKVVARHQVGDALPIVADLRDDPVQRVRAAAHRAVVSVMAAGA